jgi:hypothetical protein
MFLLYHTRIKKSILQPYFFEFSLLKRKSKTAAIPHQGMFLGYITIRILHLDANTEQKYAIIPHYGTTFDFES